jgi:hypothetical protein
MSTAQAGFASIQGSLGVQVLQYGRGTIILQAAPVGHAGIGG